jgi:hypothetical protein
MILASPLGSGASPKATSVPVDLQSPIQDDYALELTHHASIPGLHVFCRRPSSIFAWRDEKINFFPCGLLQNDPYTAAMTSGLELRHTEAYKIVGFGNTVIEYYPCEARFQEQTRRVSRSQPPTTSCLVSRFVLRFCSARVWRSLGAHSTTAYRAPPDMSPRVEKSEGE